jgi:hypothetical protein
MDDFRTGLAALTDGVLTAGAQPVYLVVDMPGAEYIRRGQGAESMAAFHNGVIAAITSAAPGSDALPYSDARIVAVLPGYARLKTFALIEKLHRVLPMLGQSFDCVIEPDFDTLEYDASTALAGVIAQLLRSSGPSREVA